MEKSLSNELFVVGVSLDCLRAGAVPDTFMDNRLSALSGQVLSDAKKIEDLETSYEDLREDWNYLAATIFEVCNNDNEESETEEMLKAVLGAKFVESLKKYV